MSTVESLKGSGSWLSLTLFLLQKPWLQQILGFYQSIGALGIPFDTFLESSCGSPCGEYQVPNAVDVFKYFFKTFNMRSFFKHVLILGAQSHLDCVCEFSQ